MHAQRHPRFALKTLAAATVACYAPLAHANPSGGTVVAGSATMQQQGNNLVVTNTPGAIINWQSFSIGQNELTRFVQQGASSAVLNRVTGQDPSKILGQLQSNGKVFLINPNGIVFGQGAQVDVAGLVASTLNISDEDFRAGRMRFEGGQTGSVRNAANITTASGGFVYLIAPNVENNGVVVSPKGEILLAAGSSVELVDGVDTSLRVRIKAPAGEALNVGQLIAEQGRIGVFAAAIRQQGLVSANRAEIGEGGKIVFKASRDVTLAAGSKTEAQGGEVKIDAAQAAAVDGAIDVSNAAGKGGQAQVLGERVAVDGRIDASGRDGGGTILVGGDYQGSNAAVRNADYTRLGTNAWLNADATEKGDGGKIVAWADQDTSAAGRISARGGQAGGNGGFAEVSGKRNLDFHTVVDLSAERGQRGKLLLDPTDFVVDSSNVGVIFSASADVMLQADQDVIFDATAGNAATSYNVSVTADRDIDIRSGATLSSSGGTVTLGATRDILIGGRSAPIPT
ncbi:two-partner secretion domain-containing protein [Chitinimonas koreensis]|uniref:two-partner secretion domain-containing protein n=1 Tax=Chitinimonas koreensis TaxID=356302 RepID=UPI001654109D|nr:filamentous hemagglutinin N-terminal domain-containing protein [Chitinimonas koreensis]QNM97681.1 filamentous hemagglutinin N-terminal domain-containing protein [Chitinimonas koreensis]